MEPLLMDLANNVFLEGDSLVIIDRRKLPREEVRVVCRDYEEVARAIENMVVQGAGDIAITAGYGLYLASRDSGPDISDIKDIIRKAAQRLKATRPTGFHLAALIDKLLKLAEAEKDAPQAILSFLQDSAETPEGLIRSNGEKCGKAPVRRRHNPYPLFPGSRTAFHAEGSP